LRGRRRGIGYEPKEQLVPWPHLHPPAHRWVIDPERQRVEVCHSPIRRQLVSSDGALDGAELLPEFQYPIQNLFKEWDWD
jgi:hypothetical protein